MEHVLVDGECTTCSPSQSATDQLTGHLHVLDNGICVTCKPSARRNFDPSEPRDPLTGEWGLGGAADGALKDTLKLASRIDLKPGEHFESSQSMDGHEGSVGLAWTRRGGARHLRLGALGEEGEWTAGNDGSTVDLDEHGIAALGASLRDMQQAGARAAADFKDVQRQLKTQHGSHAPDEAHVQHLRDEYARLIGDAAPVKQTTIYGSDFGQLRVGVAADEATAGGYDTWLVPQSRGAEPPDHLASAVGEGNGIQLTKAQLVKLIGFLGTST